MALPKPQIQDDQSYKTDSEFSEGPSSDENTVSSYSKQRNMAKQRFSSVVEDQMIMQNKR